MAKVTNVDAADVGGDDDDAVVVAAVAFFAVGSVGSSAMGFHYRPVVESFHASWNHREFPGYR